MPRYDLFANPVSAERRRTPYLLDVQNDFIDSLASRVVIPVRTVAAFGPRARDLNPLLDVEGKEFVLDTAALGAILTSELKQRVANLKPQQPAIQAAMDALFGAH